MGYPPYFVVTTSEFMDDYGIMSMAEKFSLRVASVRYGFLNGWWAQGHALRVILQPPMNSQAAT